MATRNTKQAAEERAKVLNGRDERYIEALEVERHGYVVRGKDDRVAEVDAEIAKYRKALGQPTPTESADIHVKAAVAAKAASKVATAAEVVAQGDAQGEANEDAPGEADKTEA